MCTRQQRQPTPQVARFPRIVTKQHHSFRQLDPSSAAQLRASACTQHLSTPQHITAHPGSPQHTAQAHHSTPRHTSAHSTCMLFRQQGLCSDHLHHASCTSPLSHTIGHDCCSCAAESQGRRCATQAPNPLSALPCALSCHCRDIHYTAAAS
jgi:hypothetical protein